LIKSHYINGAVHPVLDIMSGWCDIKSHADTFIKYIEGGEVKRGLLGWETGRRRRQLSFPLVPYSSPWWPPLKGWKEVKSSVCHSR